MLVTGHKSQFALVGSRFERKKQILYISLTLKQCIQLLPKEIEEYIKTYLDTNNLFAIDRYPKLILRAALHLQNAGATYFKYQRMDKNQMVSYIQTRQIQNMQYWIYKALFDKVLKNLTKYNIKIKHKKKQQEMRIRRQRRIERNIIAIKSIIDVGYIIKIKNKLVAIGIVTALRDNNITMYVIDNTVNYTNSMHIMLSGKRMTVSYKYIKHIQFPGENLQNTNLLFEKDDNVIELEYSEWSDSKILTTSIKSIL